jgi:hypothetical protein
MRPYRPWLLISRRLVPVALITISMCVHSKTQKGRDGFESWAKAQVSPIKSVELESDLSDLRPLKAMIGTARVVALGEPTHGAHEPLALRNKIFRYLVEELGFTTIALEGGLPESRLIHEYVAGGSGSLEHVLRDGFSCGIGEWKESEELVRWMRNAALIPTGSDITAISFAEVLRASVDCRDARYCVPCLTDL